MRLMAVMWVKPFVIAYRHRRYRFTHVGTDVLGPNRADLSLKFRVDRIPWWQFWRGSGSDCLLKGVQNRLHRRQGP